MRVPQVVAPLGGPVPSAVASAAEAGAGVGLVEGPGGAAAEVAEVEEAAVVRHAAVRLAGWRPAVGNGGRAG